MNAVSAVILVICSVLFWIGFLFKMQHWPGGAMAFILACTLSLIGVLFYFIARYTNKQKALSSTYAMYFMLFNILVGIIVSQPFKASKGLLNNYHEISTSLDKNRKVLEVNNQALYDLMALKDNEEQHKNALNIVQLIQMARWQMVYGTGGVDEDSVPLAKDNQEVAAGYLLFGNAEPIKEGIRKFNMDILAVNAHARNKLSLINVSDSTDYNGVRSTWEERISLHMPLIAVIASLSAMQFEVVAKENAMLNEVNRQVNESRVMLIPDTNQVDSVVAY